MKIKRFTTSTISSSVLLVGVVIPVFLVTLFPPAWHNSIYKGLFTIIYFSAVLNIDKYRKQILWFSTIAFVLTWVSECVHQETWPPLSKIGYGDLLPMEPFARFLPRCSRSPASFTLGIIVAMLVGKYASQRKDN